MENPPRHSPAMVMCTLRAALWVFAFGANCTPAGADEQNKADTAPPLGVMEQPRPEYDAQGVSLGDWLFLPSLTTAANYDDNVFRLRNGSPSDWYFETAPIARLQKKTDAWQLGISANADNFTYSRLSRLNLTDWTIAADATASSGNKVLTAALTGYYGEYHEGFESADILGFQRSQTRYFRAHIESGVNYQPGDWAITAGATLDDFSWQPTVLVDGEHISNRDRDESLFAPYVRVSYNVAPGYQLFARAAYDRRDFAQALDRFGFRRSSSGYHLDSGLRVALGATLTGEAFIGVLRQDFSRSELPRLPDISVLDYGADIQWYPSHDVTVHFTASRALSDIILPGVSMSDDQSVGLSIDWLLHKNVILQGAAAFTDSRLVGISRTDRYPSASITVRYLINRFVSAHVGYLYSGRQSDAPPVAFRDQTFSAGISLHI